MLNRRDLFKGFAGLGALLVLPKQAYASTKRYITKRQVIADINAAIKQAQRASVFEYNDSFTRQYATDIVHPVAMEHKVKGNLYDFMVVCNETNNTPEVIDGNRMVMDVYLKWPTELSFTQIHADMGSPAFIKEIEGQLK